ncbi:hypothetical protein ACIPID_09225, partial [Cupriavidus sp. CER94]|uniref:hypothetical protein n=1 Tax=Cupriavidus sp. CER94 TaxID=3377036 RepID=UPI003811E080
DDIQAEIDTQRRSLNDLRMVLDPAVLKAKLALVGEGSKQGGKDDGKDGKAAPAGTAATAAAAAAVKPEAGSTP